MAAKTCRAVGLAKAEGTKGAKKGKLPDVLWEYGATYALLEMSTAC
jgi:hypothetical protein